jgi:hypothetical protein
METGVALTGQQAIQHIYACISRDDDAGALRFWDEYGPEMLTRLTAQELGIIGDLLTSCERALGLAPGEPVSTPSHLAAHDC